MVKKILNRVTVTGADDSVEIADLAALSEEYGFVEWGVLLSKSSMGKPRFPNIGWLGELADWQKSESPSLPCSGHLCGAWVRAACDGDWSFMRERAMDEIWAAFTRFQFNFSPYVKKMDTTHFCHHLRISSPPNVLQWIFQLGNINNHIVEIATRSGVTAAPLFDLSGGKGILPGQWPEIPQNRMYCGYSGGLSAENLNEQLRQISAVCGDGPIWIDAETHLRSGDDDNERFDLDKVVAFLEVAKPWVVDV